MAAEKFNLTWNDFEVSTSNAFKELLDQHDFVDVTLVSEDNKEIQCHKLVLSASSPIFKSILLRNSHQHPLIYLTGVQHLELRSLVSFMYLGQTEVAQNDLNNFMAAASRFQIKGLSNKQQYEEPRKENASVHQIIQEAETKPMTLENIAAIFPADSMIETSNSLEIITDYEDSNNWASNSSRIVSDFNCETCEYKSKHKGDVKSHTKAQHEGIKYCCETCDYRTGYSHNLIKHKRNKHGA